MPDRRGPTTTRRTARGVHLAAAAVVGAAVYAPGETGEQLRLAVQVVVIPAATASGLVLWKQAALRRLIRRRRAHPTDAGAA